MSDVFVSYARSSEEQARQVEDALRDAGYGVWRDAELPAHRSYAEVIEERLKAARAVVVLWSQEAARSHWVRAEADSARESGTLVQASVDGTVPPIPFNQIQCAALKDWDGSSDHSGWKKLLASVADLASDGEPESVKAKPPRARKTSICILPFANMSGDSEQEYFSDGISEDITTDLSKVSALEVIARNTAFQFKGQSVDVCDVARKLGVTHVLEGSVRKAGNRLRITAQLIDGASGGHVWADRYDRDLTDIFEIQDEISHSIVAALKVKLLPEEKKAIEQRGTTNVEAYKMYLLARQYWATGNHGDPRRDERVMRICSRAVQIDPYYAQAWALLALAQSSLRYDFARDVDDGFVAAHTALSIDPTVAEAHCAIIRRLEEQGRRDDAHAELEKALQLAPESWEVNKVGAYLFRLRQDVAAATRHLEKAVEAMDTDFCAWATLATFYQAQGDAEKVREAARKMVSESEKALQQDPSNGAALGIIAGGYAILGEPERAREWIERAMLIDPDNLNMRYNFACVLATYVGDKEEALRLLEPTLAQSGLMLLKIVETDPDFDCLRDDPRFRKMIARERKRHGMSEAAVEAATPPAAS
ncbi:MAG: TPR end-of-group domain-containing protein [Sphingomicrobium sp.]